MNREEWDSLQPGDVIQFAEHEFTLTHRTEHYGSPAWAGTCTCRNNNQPIMDGGHDNWNILRRANRGRVVTAVITFDPWPFAETMIRLTTEVGMVAGSGRRVHRARDRGFSLINPDWSTLVVMSDGSTAVAQTRQHIEVGDEMTEGTVV